MASAQALSDLEDIAPLLRVRRRQTVLAHRPFGRGIPPSCRRRQRDAATSELAVGRIHHFHQLGGAGIDAGEQIGLLQVPMLRRPSGRDEQMLGLA